MLHNFHICPRLLANFHANSLLKHGLTDFNQFFYILHQISSLCMDEWIPHEWSQTCCSSFSNSSLQWSHIISLVQEWTTSTKRNGLSQNPAMVPKLLNLFAWIHLLISTLSLITISYSGSGTSYIDLERVLESRAIWSWSKVWE